MNRDEYYVLLKELHDRTDWNSLESIHNYNEQARQLRSLMEWEED